MTSTKKTPVSFFNLTYQLDVKLKLCERINFMSNGTPAQLIKGIPLMLKTPQTYLILLIAIVYTLPIILLDLRADIWAETTYKQFMTFDFLQSLEFSLLYPFACLAFSLTGFFIPLFLAQFFLLIFGILTVFVLNDAHHTNPAELFICALMINATKTFLFVNFLLGSDKIFRKSGVFLFAIYGVLWSFGRFVVSFWGLDILDWYLGLFDKDSNKRLLAMCYFPSWCVLLGLVVQKKLVMRNGGV